MKTANPNPKLTRVIEDAQSPPSGGNVFTGWLGRSLLKLTGWKIKGTVPQFPKMVIAVGPHTSNWDFFLGVAALFALRIRIRFLGKHSIFIPVVRIFLNAIGGIPVDRRSSHGVVEQVLARFNKQEKMILALSPEGTRSKIFPWKTGFLAIAHKAQVPVVLIGFDFARKEVVIGPNFMSTGQFEDEMKKVYDFYKPISAKHPDLAVFSD